MFSWLLIHFPSTFEFSWPFQSNSRAIISKKKKPHLPCQGLLEVKPGVNFSAIPGQFQVNPKAIREQFLHRFKTQFHGTEAGLNQSEIIQVNFKTRGRLRDPAACRCSLRSAERDGDVTSLTTSTSAPPAPPARLALSHLRHLSTRVANLGRLRCPVHSSPAAEESQPEPSPSRPSPTCRHRPHALGARPITGIYRVSISC